MTKQWMVCQRILKRAPRVANAGKAIIQTKHVRLFRPPELPRRLNTHELATTAGSLPNNVPSW